MSTILATSASEPKLWTTAHKPTWAVAKTAYIPTQLLIQRLQRRIGSIYHVMLWRNLPSTVDIGLATLIARLAAVNESRSLEPVTKSRLNAAMRGLSEVRAWGSKTALSWRRRVMAELGWAILSPAGNAVCLLLFWPGWWVLGFCFYATWWLGGL